MGVPINLDNVRTLELFAADYIYKYDTPGTKSLCLRCRHFVPEPNFFDASIGTIISSACRSSDAFFSTR